MLLGQMKMELVFLLRSRIATFLNLNAGLDIMKPEIIQSKKDLLKVSFKDIDQGCMGIDKDKLFEDKATEIAGFKITHPEVGELVFTLRTKGKDAKKTWNDALAAISKDLKSFEQEIKKIK